jgi:cytosine/adenosine deaminase-related metal-dependent hydrolase
MTPPTTRLVIKDAMLLTLDRRDRVIPHGYLVLEGDRIAEIGEGVPPQARPGDRVLEGRNRLVIPGLHNSHTHSYENLNRGLMRNIPHAIFMTYPRPPFDAPVPSPEEVYCRTMLGCLEMVRTGVTLVVDDVVHVPNTDMAAVEAVMQAYQDIGLRAVVTGTTVNRLYHETFPYSEQVFPESILRQFRELPRPTVADLIAFARRCLERWPPRGRVSFALSPSTPQHCSRELLEALRDLQAESGALLAIHILETRLQAVAGQVLFGTSMAAYIDELGVLGPGTTVFHGVWLDQDDVRRIAGSGATVVHSPSSNLKIGSGVARIREMLQAGIPVALGTDSMGSNDSQSIFEEMRLSGFISSLVSPRYEEWLSPGEVLRMATQGGLRVLRLETELGTLEAGRLADLALLDLSTIAFTPTNDVVRQLVNSERGGSVRTVIVGGQILMEEGNITAVDEAKMLARIREAALAYKNGYEAGWRRSRELEPYFAEIYRRASAQPVRNSPRLLWTAECTDALGATP